MLLADFDYDLPEEAIAQVPAEPRDSSRLLVLHRDSGELEHRVFHDVTEYLRPDDTLVVNDTRVIPARVHATKETGGRVEMLLLSRRNPGVWEAMVRPGKRVRPGMRLQLEHADLQVEVLDRTEGGGRILRFSGAEDPDAALLGSGEVPLPPYIHQTLADTNRYQTVYAQQAGSAAAPTAGLHFTPALMDKVKAMGVTVARVTLHIGLATFQPVREEDIADHQMHVEEY
ncbi:MAG TPA: S-adenosylmethionine:tRNA ribosyltransferase-isomerase, partial [Armatimonadota bacterium]|nr:S-adenosylmethionine:tRNA ribosyltransferase-isomerase [Armatimonadota bacterium]